MNGTASEKFRDPSLVDFGVDTASGDIRRLDLLGGMLVDRPLAMDDPPDRMLPDLWGAAAATYRPASPARTAGWTFAGVPPEPWIARLSLAETAIHLEVKPAPSGQLGIFLEQAEQWRWLAEATPQRARMLSLFAHSGAATLALAAAGAEVVHVDSSRQATALARRNATASGLDAAPIRWICEDARTFVAREIRRGTTYDGFVLDPPSWGHGPKGQAFSIERDLLPLLGDLARLVGPSRRGRPAGPLLLTCHSPRWHHRRLHDTLATSSGGPVESGRLTCTDASGRHLDLGGFARCAPLT